MNSAGFEFMMSLVFVGFFLFLTLIYFLSRSNRKYKELYGFKLPGWSVLKDDNKLWATELLFTEGLISKVLNHTGYQVSDMHSGLIRDQKDHYTGLIALTKYQSLHTYDFDGDMDFGWTQSKTVSYRYFLATLTRKTPAFLHANSTKLGPNLGTHFSMLSDELEEMEKQFGFKNWDVIAHENQLVVLVPEIFDEKALVNFLQVSEKIVSEFEARS